MTEVGLGGEPTIEPLGKTPSLADRAYETIRRAFVSGRIKPGDWLRQEVLAQELGVSPRTVREALGRLVAEGLAVHEPYKGVRTIAPSFEEIEEIYHLRAMLEGWAMEVAATRLSPEELAQMRALVPYTGGDQDVPSPQRVRDANREFHWIPVYATGRRHLIRILEQLWKFLQPHIWGELVAKEYLESYTENLNVIEHNQILEALEARDGQQARAVAVRHIMRQLDLLRTIAEAQS